MKNTLEAVKPSKTASGRIQTMKAVRIHRFGGPEVLTYEDVPRPTPGEGEVLVAVHAAGVNPLDWKTREGYRKETRPQPLPLIPGWDFSGLVEAKGPGAVRFKIGDEVYGRPDFTRDGAYAEFIVVRETEIALKPKSLDHVHAGGVALAALTAWQALFDCAKLEAGRRVLIHRAAGGVGGFAVQLAKWRGARVIGTAASRNHDYVRSLGADEVIDYETTRFEDAARDVDLVLDSVGGEVQRRSLGVLNKGGLLVSLVGPVDEAAAKSLGVRGIAFRVTPDASELAAIAKLIDTGVLKVIVAKVYPLSEAKSAQERSQCGHTRGKIVLKVR